MDDSFFHQYNTKMDRIEDRIDKIYEDMYLGDGQDNPSVTTRLDRIERSIAGLDKLFWVVVAGIIAAVGDIIVHHMH